MAETPKLGSIVHVEIQSNDKPATSRFFREVFGWKMQEFPEMDYTMWTAAGGPGGGITAPQSGMGPGTLNHILSSAIEADVRKIEAAGGAILLPKTEIPQYGWFAVFREPGGAVMALYQNLPRTQAAEKKPAKKATKASAKKATKRKARR